MRVTIRISRDLFFKFKKILKKNPEIKTLSQGVRVAVIRYIIEAEKKKIKHINN